ncbi:MAG: S8 family serine peptidase [Elusimicrobiota bacterium]
MSLKHKHGNFLTITPIRTVFGILILFIFNLSISADLVSIKTNQGTIKAVPNQILVRYKKGQMSTGKLSVKRSFGIQAQKTLTQIETELVPVPKGQTIESFIEQMKSNPYVESAEPNGIMKAFTAPNDPKYDSQYYLNSTHINIEPAWDITFGNASVVTAVIDTGVDYNHPDINDNMWINPSPSGTSGVNGSRTELDFNGDGDCVDSDAELGNEQCASNDPLDNNNPIYHGTRVAGIIAAETNNAAHVAGIARGTRIMAVKCLNEEGFGTFSSIADAILYAVNNGANVINLSLGGDGGSSAVSAALEQAFNRDIVVVAAAGNSGNASAVSFPASVEKVIAVGATTSTDALAFFSSTGNSLDLVAPGVGIVSLRSTNQSDGNDIDGTSFSSPMVAGVAALIKSLKPNMSLLDVTKYLNFTADDLGATGFDHSFGFGRLNATKALQAVNSGTIFTANPSSPNKSFPYPNPFNPSTHGTMSISIPSQLGSSGIEITILTLSGEKVKTISGTNAWDGKNEDGNIVSSGLYFYIAKTSLGETKGKLTVLK